MAVCSIYVKVFGFILASYWSHIKIQFRVMKTVVKINKAKNLFSGLNTSAKYSKYVDLGAFCIQRKGLRKKKNRRKQTKHKSWGEYTVQRFPLGISFCWCFRSCLLSSRFFGFLKFLQGLLIPGGVKHCTSQPEGKKGSETSKLSKHQSMEIAGRTSSLSVLKLVPWKTTQKKTHAKSMASLLNQIAAYKNCSHVAIILRIPKGSSSLSHCYKSP